MSKELINKSNLYIGIDYGVNEQDCSMATLTLHYNDTLYVIYQTDDKEQIKALDEIAKAASKNQQALQLVKAKSKKNYNLALVVDSGTYEQYCKQFEYFLNDYKERAGAFEIWEEDKYSFEEYNLLREVFVYE